jgi:transcription antitermination factor NusG
VAEVYRGTSSEGTGISDAPLLEFSCPKWYAVYTFAHHEKRVNERLAAKNISTFLPLYTTRHRRQSGIVLHEVPLFPGYLFAFIPLFERLKVLQVAGVARLVGTGGKPTPLPEFEIEALRNARTVGIYAEPHPYLEIGRKVRIKAGPFEGLQGILLRRKGKYRVVLSLVLIASSFVLDVDSCDVEPVKDHRAA